MTSKPEVMAPRTGVLDGTPEKPLWEVKIHGNLGTLSRACLRPCSPRTRSRSHSSSASLGRRIACSGSSSQCESTSKPGSGVNSWMSPRRWVIYEAFVEEKTGSADILHAGSAISSSGWPAGSQPERPFCVPVLHPFHEVHRDCTRHLPVVITACHKNTVLNTVTALYVVILMSRVGSTPSTLEVWCVRSRLVPRRPPWRPKFLNRVLRRGNRGATAIPACSTLGLYVTLCAA